MRIQRTFGFLVCAAIRSCAQCLAILRATAGQAVGIKQVEDHIWLTSFMDYDLGYFDDETCRLEPLPNPFGPKVLPMSQE